MKNLVTVVGKADIIRVKYYTLEVRILKNVTAYNCVILIHLFLLICGSDD